IARENDLVFDEITLYETQLMHGPVGRLVARKEFGIEDEEVLSAIEFHTTGKANMTLLEKIIYLSDFIEPTRNYKGVRKLRKLALTNLDQALAMAFDNTIRFVISIESVLHPRTIEARNYLLMNTKEEKNGSEIK
ncbi:MAG: HD domain-containing protein, partial [Eubacteriaceae bacterium]|nr:HD domain-containing protein [Eubacteriaceae bacterium]